MFSHLEQADRYLVKIRVPENDKNLPFGKYANDR